jgi:hypothetical protein
MGVVFVFLFFCFFVRVPVLGVSVPPEENTWVEVASLQQARCNLGAAVVDGRIYAIGGRNELGAVGTVEMYDPQTNRWTYMTSMPTPRSGFAIVSFMGKIYCMGGFVSTTEFTAVVEVYDPEIDRWETRASMLFSRAGVSACVVDGCIYVMGGFRYMSDSGSRSGIWQVYDPIGDVWDLKDFSWPEGCDCVVLGDRVYVLGSFELWVYDVLSDSWAMGAQAPISSAYRSVAAVRGVMAPYAIYAYTNNYCLEVYCPFADNWVRGADLPRDLLAVEVVELDDRLYVLGGLEVVYTSSYGIPTAFKSEFAFFRSVFVYTPFGYGRVAPVVSVLSLEDMGEYGFGDVVLEFGLNRPVVLLGYSLDGQANVTVSGNVTLSGLSGGWHNVTVFAEDEFGNVGVSKTITFMVASAPFSLLPIVAVVGLIGVIVCVGLFWFLRKRRYHKSLQVG